MRNKLYIYLFVAFFWGCMSSSCSKEKLENESPSSIFVGEKNYVEASNSIFFYPNVQMRKPDPGTGEMPPPSKGFTFDGSRWYRNVDGTIVISAFASSQTSTWSQYGDNCDAKVHIMLLYKGEIYNGFQKDTVVYGYDRAYAALSCRWELPAQADLDGFSIAMEGYVWGCFKTYGENPAILNEISWSERQFFSAPQIIPVEGRLTTPYIAITEQKWMPNISWSRVQYATDYEVWRQQDNGEFVKIAVTSDCFLLDREVVTKPIKESWFRYKVLAKSKYSTSLFSNEVAIQGQVPN